MKPEKFDNEINIRRFLLGEMPESERSAFEENFISDENLFEEIRVVEDELIESYVCGMMNPAERVKFEKVFLTAPKRRQKIEFTRSMLNQIARTQPDAAVKNFETSAPLRSVWAAIAEFFQTPKFAFATGLALLLLSLGGLFFWLNRPKVIEPQIVQNVETKSPEPAVSPTPTYSATVTPESVSSQNVSVKPNVNAPSKNESNKAVNSIPKTTENRNQTEKKPQIEPPKPKPVISTLALFAGTVRSDGKTNELNLPKDSNGANLQLNLESQDYKTYRAEIVDQNGNIIYRSGKLSAKNSKVNTFVSAQKLKRGDYIVKLYGKNAATKEESVADYQFRVNYK